MKPRTVPLLITAIMIAGCATVVAPLEPPLVSERLPFIYDGKTSKEEVLSRLGEPDSRYEGGRILTYKMCEDISLEGRLRFSNSCSPKRTNTLILVFGPDDLIERHSLVLLK